MVQVPSEEYFHAGAVAVARAVPAFRCTRPVSLTIRPEPAPRRRADFPLHTSPPAARCSDRSTGRGEPRSISVAVATVAGHFLAGDGLHEAQRLAVRSRSQLCGQRVHPTAHTPTHTHTHPLYASRTRRGWQQPWWMRLRR